MESAYCVTSATMCYVAVGAILCCRIGLFGREWSWHQRRRGNEHSIRFITHHDRTMCIEWCRMGGMNRVRGVTA
jgi:hypothetical protein